MPVIISDLDNSKRSNIDGQIGLFGDNNEDIIYDYKPSIEGEFTLNEKLRFEKEYTGIYISGHPLAAVENDIKALKDMLESDMYREFYNLIQYMLSEGIKLEQEIINYFSI